MKLVLISSAVALVMGASLYLAATPPAKGQSEAVYTSQSASENVDSRAKYPTEVVELFTSQGCSSCPPADRFVASLSDSPTTIALSFSVTYWDYLGWKDKFGKRDFTKRQKSYARSLGVGNVYTPQIVLNGRQHSNIFSRSDVTRASLPDDRPLIDVADEGEQLTVKAGALNLSDYDLTIVAYQPGMQTTPVSRGENRNRNLQNYNVVSGVYPLEAESRYSLDTSTHPEGMAYVLLATEPSTAQILSVTHISAN